MIWVAFYWDFSELAIFEDELEARKFAGPRHMEVEEVPLGQSVRAYLLSL